MEIKLTAVNRKKITVITATFNLIKGERQNVFVKMFKSVHAQTYPNIEHLIIDGGSKDGTLEFIEQINKKYGKKELRVISEPDKGITDATIKGYKNARGEYIILMCSDDYYLRNDALELLANELEKEQADFVCADGWWLFCRVWKADLESFVSRHPFIISTMLGKKSLFDKYGHFDPSYEMLADYELMFRLLTNPAIKGAVVPQTLTVLRPGGFSQTKMDLFVKETVQIYQKYFNPKCRLSTKDCKMLHWAKPTAKLYARILRLETNPRILNSIRKYHNKRELFFYRRRIAFLSLMWNKLYYFLFRKHYFDRDTPELFLPSWLGHMCCWFIWKKENRHKFRAKYVRPQK